MRSLIRIVCSAAFALSMTAATATFATEPAAGTTDILAVPAARKATAADVKGMLDRKEAVFIYDANERESFLAGHIPGAQWIQFDAVTAAKLPKSKDAKLLFYCYNPQCGASPLAAKMALSLGYHNVWLMPEGITGWRSAHMPVVVGTTPK